MNPPHVLDLESLWWEIWVYQFTPEMEKVQRHY